MHKHKYRRSHASCPLYTACVSRDIAFDASSRSTCIQRKVSSWWKMPWSYFSFLLFAFLNRHRFIFLFLNHFPILLQALQKDIGYESEASGSYSKKPKERQMRIAMNLQEMQMQMRTENHPISTFFISHMDARFYWILCLCVPSSWFGRLDFPRPIQ